MQKILQAAADMLWQELCRMQSSFANAREQLSREEEQALKHAFRKLEQACQ